MDAEANTVKCQECGRKLTSPASVAARRGPGCRAKIRKTAAAVQAAMKPEQHAKVIELIEDQGIVRTSRPGVFAATSSDGTAIYRVDMNTATCTCKAGQNGRSCYHAAAAEILTAARALRAA